MSQYIQLGLNFLLPFMLVFNKYHLPIKSKTMVLTFPLHKNDRMMLYSTFHFPHSTSGDSDFVGV